VPDHATPKLGRKRKAMARGDGKLRLAFVYTGQGDCILIACPNGKVAMIDCGTARWEAASLQQIKDMVFSADFLQNYNKLDLLILTHADKDHYNQLKQVLKDRRVAINRLYYGNALKTYTGNFVGYWLAYEANVTAINSFTLNQASQQKVKKEVLDGTSAGGPDCKLYLLAGNVAKVSSVLDGNDEKNTASLVTLVQFGGSRILLCGDATRTTESFLMANFADDIRNLHILQVPHHGSETTSSQQGFVNLVNPTTAVISAAQDSGNSLKLPRASVIQNYINGGRLEDYQAHQIYFWEQVPTLVKVRGQNRLKKIWTHSSNTFQKNIVVTGCGGTVTIALE
jgi:beta-lactamase superfamily II metal-dependent hydrolase